VKVTLTGVSKYFGDFQVLNNIDLTIDEGELFFLLGPSGCGKTTTLRIIAGFYKPESGDLSFNDKNVLDVPPYKRNVGMVFQNYALWPHMTSYDNIVYGLKVRKVPLIERVERAKKALIMVQMEDFALRYPNQLSGGQQQRIALARAIVTEPDVLLLDEPLSNLDAKLRLETRYEIKRLQSELGITSIYVTHDQEEALSMADKIAVMNKGKIEQIGSPREIYGNPNNRFVAGFIGETNFVEAEVHSQSGRGLLLNTVNGEEIFVKLTSGEYQRGQKVICSIRPENIKLVDEKPLASKGQQLYAATIETLTYYGLLESYILVGFGNVTLNVKNFDPESRRRKVGDKVFISFDPDDVAVFTL